MSELHCYYHTSRTAHDKCEDCGKYLCLECKMSFSKHHSSGDPGGSGYSTSHVYCPECFGDHMQRKQTGNVIQCIMVIVVLVVMVLSISGSDFFGSNDPGLAIFVLIIVIVAFFAGIGFFVSKVTKDEKPSWEKIRDNALEARKQNLGKSDKGIQFICGECGKLLGINQFICDSCGYDNTKSASLS